MLLWLATSIPYAFCKQASIMLPGKDVYLLYCSPPRPNRLCPCLLIHRHALIFRPKLQKGVGFLLQYCGTVGYLYACNQVHVQVRRRVLFLCTPCGSPHSHRNPLTRQFRNQGKYWQKQLVPNAFLKSGWEAQLTLTPCSRRCQSYVHTAQKRGHPPAG